jgi:V-type H+-transporting ATPase subunit A
MQGNYTLKDTIVDIETFDGKPMQLKMSHYWPVRQVRPTIEKLAGNVPLLTG